MHMYSYNIMKKTLLKQFKMWLFRVDVKRKADTSDVKKKLLTFIFKDL